MKRKIACLLALALAVTSLASCSKASGDRSDDLRVEREGGDYKHEYGLEIETETHPIVTTETSEEPPVTTTESTTTSTNNTSTVNITPGKTMDVGEFCYLMVNYLGSHYNDATSALNSYSSIPLEEYYTGDYDDEKWIMYNCAIGVGSVIFDICDVSFYTTDGKVYSLDFSATITEGDKKEAYLICWMVSYKAVLSWTATLVGTVMLLTTVNPSASRSDSIPRSVQLSTPGIS